MWVRAMVKGSACDSKGEGGRRGRVMVRGREGEGTTIDRLRSCALGPTA